ncbi:hypothetical protein PI124_g16878 [Phytophthora idaei]|nr:hypothetical protein PI125_g13605 [Phytophthora idaei]KAG3147821.1 hypothetical protein PI126_g12724 [Phytophthora idaei]KAG3238152.1 hypothetical protein PI124_g16878 [Phytophthora idaei]
MTSYRQSTGGSGGYDITPRMESPPDEEAQHGDMVEPQANLEEQEAGGQAQHGIELLSSTVEQETSTVPTIDELPPADETLLARCEYEKVTALPLAELQTCFREQI